MEVKRFRDLVVCGTTAEDEEKLGDEAREIVKSGYAGWIRKRRRREESGQDLYRSAAASLPARVRGKLTGKESWYKDKKRGKPDEFDSSEGGKQPLKKRKIGDEKSRELCHSQEEEN